MPVQTIDRGVTEVNVAAWIVGVVLMGVFALSGITKLLDIGQVPAARRKFGYRKLEFRLIGLSELAGVAGLLVGLIWFSLEFIGIAAAVGLTIVMFGALMAHARVEDEAKEIVPAAVMLVLAVLFIVLISLR